VAASLCIYNQVKRQHRQTYTQTDRHIHTYGRSGSQKIFLFETEGQERAKGYPPHQLEGAVERCRLPQGFGEGAPTANSFWITNSPENASIVAANVV